MAGWIDVARDLIGREGAGVRASLVGVRGSAPREAGAMMLITRTSIWQTIGGGTLEYEIMAGARDLIAAPDAPCPTLPRPRRRQPTRVLLSPAAPSEPLLIRGALPNAAGTRARSTCTASSATRSARSGTRA